MTSEKASTEGKCNRKSSKGAMFVDGARAAFMILFFLRNYVVIFLIYCIAKK